MSYKEEHLRKFELYSIVVRYLTYKITENLRKIYLDIDFESQRMLLTAYYIQSPSAIELDLFDDIVTNSNAPIPDLYVDADIKLMEDYNEDEKHDFLVFAFFEPSHYDLGI